jgi:hypothetical protein
VYEYVGCVPRDTTKDCGFVITVEGGGGGAVTGVGATGPGVGVGGGLGVDVDALVGADGVPATGCGW